MAPRIFAVFPIVLSATVVALTIVLMVSGSGTGNGTSNYWLSKNHPVLTFPLLNTSKIGSESITIEPTSTTSGSPSTTTGTDPLTSIASGLDGIFGGLLNNVTGQIDQGIEDLSAQLITNITKALGVKDVYNLFITHMCQGMYADPNNPKSSITITSCYSYDDMSRGLRNISKSIPSSFVVANQNISVPLISALGRTTDSVLGLATGGSKAMLAFLIISCVSLGLTMLISVAAIVLGYRRLVCIACTVLSNVGANVLLLLAVLVTSVIVAGSNTINDFGGAFQLDAKKGGAFLAMTWVATVLSFGVSWFWTTVWFVEARRTSFRRRWRTEDQIGNYGGILRETMEDLRKPSKLVAVQYQKEGVLRQSSTRSVEMAAV